jgi:hypothetical protein
VSRFTPEAEPAVEDEPDAEAEAEAEADMCRWIVESLLAAVRLAPAWCAGSAEAEWEVIERKRSEERREAGRGIMVCALGTGRGGMGRGGVRWITTKSENSENLWCGGDRCRCRGGRWPAKWVRKVTVSPVTWDYNCNSN